MKYVYLIAYVIAYGRGDKYGNGQGFGSLTYTTPQKIKSNRTFEETQQILRNQTGYDTLGILSFQLIGKEKTK